MAVTAAATVVVSVRHLSHFSLAFIPALYLYVSVCVCVCVRACVRACVRVCVCVCV